MGDGEGDEGRMWDLRDEGSVADIGMKTGWG